MAVEFADSLKPIVNVYLENSGSMNGYVKGTTEFEQSVYSYLSDIKISNVSSALNLFYINSKLIPQGSDISDFIEKLEPATFKLKGGDQKTTDISNLLKEILKSKKKNTISIFVSDCIFSPGKGMNAAEYLLNQQIGIKTNFAEYLNKEDLCVMIYQLSSKFNGIYYNREDTKITINNQRPFYILILGERKHITDLRNTVKKENIKGSGVKNTCILFKGKTQIDFGILQSPKWGRFERDKLNKRHITNIEKETHGPNSGKFMFAVGVDFSKLPLDENYLLDIKNYIINDKDYQIKVTPYNNPDKKYTHIIQLSTSIIKSSNLTIKLKNILPKWVEDMNDDIGLDINANGAMNKTFGIKYLIGGIYDAYTVGGEDCYLEIKNISIN